MTKGTRSLFSIAIKAYKSVINKAETHWEALHPKSFKGYTLCKNGINMYMNQLNTFIQTRTKFMTGSSFSSFNRKELYIFRTFPSTMIKSTPILIISLLPGSMLLMPLLFLFPHKLLTQNFWTDEQKSKFFQHDLQLRQQYLDKVESDFIKQIKKLHHNKEINDDLMDLCMSILSTETKLGENIHELKPLFENHLNLYSLSLPYMWHLKKCYPIPMNFILASREKLRRFSTFLAYEDQHLQNENLNELSKSDLFELCLTRGLNPYVFDKEDLLDFLKQWSHNSSKATVENHSFRLHLILLISNRYRKKNKSQ